MGNTVRLCAHFTSVKTTLHRQSETRRNRAPVDIFAKMTARIAMRKGRVVFEPTLYIDLITYAIIITIIVYYCLFGYSMLSISPLLCFMAYPTITSVCLLHG